MPTQRSKNKRNIVLVSAILLLSLSLMTWNVKQEKGTRFLDSIAGIILSPVQIFFAHTIQSASDSISHYFFLVDVARQNNHLKLEVKRLINEKNKHGKEYITIALNPRSDEINKYLISQVCKQINKINVADLMKYKLILKLHPEMKLKFWKKVFFETVKQNKLKIKFDCFSGNNHIIINKTKILVVLSSSITLEAFMCDVPVVALDIPQIYNNPFVYFKRLEGSIVNIENLSEKIEKILTDREYSRDFIYKQRLALNHEVSYFDSSVRELKWVNNFVK